MSVLLNFVNNRKQDLVQIYTKERHKMGIEGVLWILQTPEGKVNVSYLPLSDLPEALLNELDELKKENKSDSIIYFYVCDPLMAQIIQIDLREFDPNKSQMAFVKPHTTYVEDTTNKNTSEETSEETIQSDK